MHILNKKEFIYEQGRDFRRNIIIIGDILEDVKMVKEEAHDVVLKIGYLNNLEKNSNLLDNFLNTFDVVIAGDGSLVPVNYIIERAF